MDYITEKFSKLGCDNAPGQETLQKQEALPMEGDPIPGTPVDFSHGDVDAHKPIPGSLEKFVEGYVVGGGHQAYTEYRGKSDIRAYLAQKLTEFSGAPVDAASELILTPGTQGALFLAMGAPSSVAGTRWPSSNPTILPTASWWSSLTASWSLCPSTGRMWTVTPVWTWRRWKRPSRAA